MSLHEHPNVKTKDGTCEVVVWCRTTAPASDEPPPRIYVEKAERQKPGPEVQEFHGTGCSVKVSDSREYSEWKACSFEFGCNKLARLTIH